jgi:7-keto-8-aminopelargonate synthetase-like enzyme
MLRLQARTGNFITLKGKTYCCFAGNDYLGLAGHPENIKAATLALQQYGVNFSASRQTTGTSDIHLELEQLLAEFKVQEDAIVFATGYMGNRLLLENLKERYSAIFADSMAHPSILDAIPRGFSEVCFYNHCDPDHLESLLNKSNSHHPLIITDGIFALTGEIAPLNDIYTLAVKHNAILVVDDAHATGVLGENGRGTPEYFGLDGAANIFQSETMSKALGSYGGFLSGKNDFIRKIRHHSTFYGASTALPSTVVAAACSSLKILKENSGLRENLMGNAYHLRKGIREAGFSTSGENTPIIPVYFRERQSAQHLSAWLEEQFIVAPAVDYPVKTEQYIVRFTVSATHTPEQIENFLRLLNKWRDKHGRYNH